MGDRVGNRTGSVSVGSRMTLETQWPWPAERPRRPKFLTLPCGGTIAAHLIMGVRVLPAEFYEETIMKCERVKLTIMYGDGAKDEIIEDLAPHAFARKAIELQRNPWED